MHQNLIGDLPHNSPAKEWLEVIRKKQRLNFLKNIKMGSCFALAVNEVKCFIW